MNDQLPIPNSPSLPIAATGVSQVDEAIRALSELDRLDVTEHAAIFSDIHQKLSLSLTEITN